MSIVKNAKWLAVLATVFLGGCIDFTVKSNVQKDGSMVGEAEIAVSASMMAMIASQEKGNGNGDLFKECGGPVETAPGVTASSAKGMRNDPTGQPMVTCTFKFTMADPTKHFADAKKVNAKSGGDIQQDFLANGRFERIDGGYRLAHTLKFPKDASRDKDMKDNPFVPMMMAMMANHYFAFTLCGQRIENASGIVSEDGKCVTWKIPVVALLMTPDFTQDMRADIYYGEEGVIGKAKRLWRSL
jgi:hypothetical protein